MVPSFFYQIHNALTNLSIYDIIAMKSKPVIIFRFGGADHAARRRISDKA